MMLHQRQVQLAIAYSSGKDLFMFFEAFYFTAASLLLVGMIKKKVRVVYPYQRRRYPLSRCCPFRSCTPTNMICSEGSNRYELLCIRRNKMERIKKEAGRLIKEEPERFYFPEGNGIVTREEYHEILNIKPKK